ncbi:MAG: protein kinase, partial [Candidatus Brocadiae bacterium]|nr:protein kinase [Candidatus Brocadiia bacterium]
MAKHPAKCPKCGHRVDFDSAVGDHIVCAVCHARLRVPGKGKAHEVTRSPTLTGSPADADPLIGQTLGEFEIVELLGRGGMGAVYKARQASLGRFVAIKILPHSLAANQSFIERFSREARAAAAVSHPNIIEVHAVGQDRGYQYIAMEFVDGETLADVLRREGRLLPHRALAILKQVASALAEGHECGILHRDIKPSNILIDRKGRAKVADFGLAKHEGVDVSVTTTGQALGTPLYMPPEAARGEPFDARSDLYSLGATFYQAVAGKPPFEADTPAQLVVKHLEAKPPPLQSVAPDCPGDLCRIIHRLLRKKPDQRYASTDELLDALDKVETRMTVEQAAATASIATRPATARHSTHRREGVALPKRSTALIAGGIAAALLLVAIVLVVVLWPKGGRATKATVPPGTRTPTTQHRPPSPDAARLEANAAIVYKNIATCIAKKDYAKAQTWLDKLRREYASTEF